MRSIQMSLAQSEDKSIQLLNTMGHGLTKELGNLEVVADLKLWLKSCLPRRHKDEGPQVITAFGCDNADKGHTRSFDHVMP